MAEAGRLYVIGTPIGNLEDITLRALRVLKEADLIAAEDTRRTRQLLAHYEIRKPVLSYHKFNSRASAPQIISALREGRRVALVTDAGTPGVSDPGSYLVQRAAAEGIRVEPVPGPSAVTAALSASGFYGDAFRFAGFPPARKGERREFLAGLRFEEDTLIFFESPQRLSALLADLVEIMGNREAVVVRELSKVHEEFCRGPLADLAARFSESPPLGEITVILAGREEEKETVPEIPLGDELRKYLRAGFPESEVLELVAFMKKIPKRTVYREMLKLKGGTR
ncbi:MAG: 16S rRNA (cytidine(1402)-2'-O)-methyltransferase [bacterium]|nr:16S rRNA (cytidine(1402)-2'-O)-methyltransferase [bacterium]